MLWKSTIVHNLYYYDSCKSTKVNEFEIYEIIVCNQILKYFKALGYNALVIDTSDAVNYLNRTSMI